MRKLVYYVGVSIDGYIAGPENQFDFYPTDPAMLAWSTTELPETIPTHLRHHVNMAVDEPNKRFDTVLMGRGSYEPGLREGAPNPYAHLRQYVISSSLAPVDGAEVELVRDDPVGLVQRLKKESGADIWLCGGGNLAAQLLGEIDELIIKSYPVVAGGGISVFAGAFDPTVFVPTRRESFDNGTQVTWFARG